MDKTPAISAWTELQRTPMTAAEVAHHFVNGTRLSVIGGKVSGNLECIDFDNPDLYVPFLEWLTGHDPELAARLVKVKTPRGYHLIYKCFEAVGGNQKLANAMVEVPGAGKWPCEWRPGTEYEAKQIDVRWFISPCAIETRGEGGYFQTSPSPGYELIENSLFDCPVLTPDQVKKLHVLAKMFDERPPEQKNSGNNNVGNIGVEFNASHSVNDILMEHGWVEAKRTTAGIGWTRPGKDRGTSGVLLDRTGNFYVWSSNASPLESGRSYDAFGLFTMYEHGGNFTRAAALHRTTEHIKQQSATSCWDDYPQSTRDLLLAAWDRKYKYLLKNAKGCGKKRGKKR